MRGWTRILLVLLVACAASAHAATTQPASAQNLKPVKWVTERIDQILTKLNTDQDFATAGRDLDALLDQALAWAPNLEPNATEIAKPRQLVAMMERLPANPAGRKKVWAALKASPKFAETLAFLVSPQDGGEGLGEVILRLQSRFGKQLEGTSGDATAPTMAAALCVVWDIGVGPTDSNGLTPPEQLFDFYVVQNTARFAPALTTIPQMMVYVVDVRASVDDLRVIQKRFQRSTKNQAKMRLDPWKNLLASPESFLNPDLVVGGPRGAGLPAVASDPVVVAKALAMPAAPVEAMQGSVAGTPMVFGAEITSSQTRSDPIRGGQKTSGEGEPFWNLDAARPTFAPRMPGQVLDPQTGQKTTLGRLARMARGGPNTRSVIGLSDAAERLGKVLGATPPRPQSDDATTILNDARALTPEYRLAILFTAAHGDEAYLGPWDQVNELVKANKLEPKHVREFYPMLFEISGTNFPDFMVEETQLLISGLPDLVEQVKIWDRVFDRVKGRPDLQAAVRMQQGALYEKAEDPDKAGQMYDAVLTQFANDGAYVTDALKAAEKLLVKMKRPQAVLPMYTQTWRRLVKPNVIDNDVYPRSNWYRVGMLLADRLDNAGQKRDGDKVRAEMGAAGNGSR